MVQALIRKRYLTLIALLCFAVVAAAGGAVVHLVTRSPKETPVREILISARNYAFNENNPEIRVKPGEHVRFVFHNDEPEAVRHNFRVVGLDRDCGRKLEPGETEVIDMVMPESGEYAYTCCAHPGMGGRLVVEGK